MACNSMDNKEYTIRVSVILGFPGTHAHKVRSLLDGQSCAVLACAMRNRL